MAEPRLLKLSDEVFWADVASAIHTTVDEALAKQALVFAIDAPRGPVHVVERDTLPVAAISTAPYAEAVRWSFRMRTILVATSLGDGRTYADFLDRPRREMERSPRSADEPVEAGMLGDYAIADARSVLSLPWRTDRYVISMLSGAKIANQVTVEVIGADVDMPMGPEFQAAIAAAASDPSAFVRQVMSPEIPDSLGVTFLSAPTMSIGDAGPLYVHGALRTVVSRRFLVPEARRSESAPTAVVPITFLATGSIDPSPRLWYSEVPVFSAQGTAEEEYIATGYFNLMLGHGGNLTRMAQTVFLYALCGRHLAGPTVMDVRG